MPVKPTTKVNENTSCRLQFKLVDYDGTTGISSANITSATMTLTDQYTGEVINSRSSVDVSSYFDVNGNFSMVLDAADNVIVNTSSIYDSGTVEETHIATFVIQATSGGGSLQLTEEVWIIVTNLKQTT